MKKLLSYLFFLTALGLYGQSKIDSLNNALKSLPEKSIDYVKNLNELGYEYWIVDSNKSIDYGKAALSISDSLNFKEGQAKANRVLGVAFWTRGNHVNAIKHLDTALKQFKALNNVEDSANTTLNIAMVYASLKDNDKALQMYEDAINQFTALDLKSRIATTFTKIASIYLEQNRLYEAKEYLNNALKMHTENDFTYGISEVHNRLGILYLKQNEKELAYYHIEKSIATGREVNDRDGMTSNLIQYAKLLLLDNEFETAEMHLDLAIKRAKEFKLKRYELEAYHQLNKLYRKEGKLQEALNFNDKYIQLKDSIYNSENSMRIAAMQFENDLTAKENELELLQEKEYTNNIIKWILIFGLLVLMFAATFFLLNLKKQNRQKAELQATKEDFNKTELENSRLKELELMQKLDYRNKELTSYTLNFIQKNELFQQLTEKIDALKEATPKQKDKIISDLKRTIKLNSSIDRDWEDFKRFFEEVHTEFNQKLKEKHPDLSSNDLKICALARLNLNIKEAATILGITPESVKTARYRLRKKLNLDQNEELLSYFLSLEKE